MFDGLPVWLRKNKTELLEDTCDHVRMWAMITFARSRHVNDDVFNVCINALLYVFIL